jgi:predicted porin
VLEYGRGAIAAMAAYERNSIGDKDVFVGGKYTAGGWALMTAYDDSRAPATAGRSRSTTVGASYRLNQTVTLKTGYGRQRLNAAINHFVSMGADYALSRRTTLYGSLGYKRDALAPARTSFGFGISHTF